MLHYLGDIKVDKGFIVVMNVENFIPLRTQSQPVIKIYVDGGTRGSRICLVDTNKDLTVIKTRAGDLTNNELEYLALLYALEYIRSRKTYYEKS